MEEFLSALDNHKDASAIIALLIFITLLKLPEIIRSFFNNAE